MLPPSPRSPISRTHVTYSRNYKHQISLLHCMLIMLYVSLHASSVSTASQPTVCHSPTSVVHSLNMATRVSGVTTQALLIADTTCRMPSRCNAIVGLSMAQITRRSSSLLCSSLCPPPSTCPHFAWRAFRHGGWHFVNCISSTFNLYAPRPSAGRVTWLWRASPSIMKHRLTRLARLDHEP
jgi:hypothetical protein